MGNVYVVSDLNGHLTQFIKLMRHIDFSEEDRMLVLGNAVSGGPQPIELLQFLIEHKERIGFCLGVAEILMLKSLLEKDFEIFTQWSTDYSGKMIYEKFKTLSDTEQHRLLIFLRESPSFFIVDRFFLSNGGLKIWEEKPAVDVEKPTLEELMKSGPSEQFVLNFDSEFYQKPGLSDYTIVFGSIPVQHIRGQDKNNKIWFDSIHEDKIGINCNVNYPPHKLGCLRLNDLKQFYI